MNDLVKNLKNIKVIKGKKKKAETSYLNLACSFDIEVSSFYTEDNKKRATMYVYAFGIDKYVKTGRTWDEFLNDINFLIKYFNLSLSKRLIIYVHNLGYEFQFIRKLFTWSEVFSNEERRPIYAITTDGIEFRCSYYLSNLSLEKVGENLNDKNIKKLVGYLDYDKIRTSTTPLTDKEIEYVTYDVKVVLAYINSLIKSEGNITNIPLTSTGFVRKYCRKICLNGDKNGSYRSLMKELTLTPEIYNYLKLAYSGGFTHASAWWVMKKVNNVHSYDFTSSYVAQLVSKKYPMSRFIEITDKVNERNIDKFIDKFACLFELTLYDVENTFMYESYISKSKCVEVDSPITDNGRIDKSKMLKVVITEIDYKIIKQVYSFSHMKIGKFFVAIKDFLPKKFIFAMLNLYKDKTELKGVNGKEEEYLKAKGQLNACYGMCATDVLRDEIIYTDFNEWSTESKNVEEEIKNYNESKTRFLYYPWGVWDTAYSRNALWSGIFSLKSDYIYSDTDSLKFINLENHKDYFEEYNKGIIKELMDVCNLYNIPLTYIIPCNKKGEMKPLGVWDYEGKYDTFKTLGAKRYLVKKDNKYILTCAGVSKTNGSEYLVNTYKTEEEIFDNFTDNLEFPSDYTDDLGNIKEGNGKKTHTYIDFETEGDIKDYLGNIGHYHELSSIHLCKCNFKISMSEIYLNYLLGLKEKSIIYEK